MLHTTRPSSEYGRLLGLSTSRGVHSLHYRARLINAATIAAVRVSLQRYSTIVMSETSPTLCECGSGLSATRCCALDPAFAGEADDPVLTAEAQRAADALHAGKRTEAERLALSVLERAPRLPTALAVLAEICFDGQRRRAAAALLERLFETDESNFWTVNKLALLELGRGNLAEGERYARHGVRIAPENAQAHHVMGLAMTAIGRASTGEYHYGRALDLTGSRNPMIVSNLAVNLKNQGRMEEARALFAEANAAAPTVRQTLLGWAQLEEADRKLDAAQALIDRAEQLAPPSPATKLVLAAVLRRQDRYDAALALLDPADPTQAQKMLPAELLERGRLLDRMGRYDEAWTDFMAGKARGRALSGKSYQREDVRAQTDNLKAFFERARIDLLPRAGVREDGPQPIFVLGFPRSGTTLVEQTLTASPDIAAGDELPLIEEIAMQLPRLLNSPWDYPGALAELWMGDQRHGLDIARDHYLLRVREMGVLREGARFFTDKMPLNEVHLGLIGLIFPNAPLLHLIRHPLDIMVSAMSNSFTHGHFCGTALETAAEHLVLSHDLVAHYRAQMDLRYLAVRYENLIDDQEATVRKIFDFVGAPYDPSVLAFEKNVRYARTASYAQVTEKLYDRSRYRYRHYLRHLEPALPILQPLIERLGYEIETPA